MKIHELRIQGFKSIGDIRLIDPNPFSVFVGPNASGKSNIFEALEFMQSCNYTIPHEAIKLFGTNKEITNYILNNKEIHFLADLGQIKPELSFSFYDKNFVKPYNQYGKMFHITNPALLNAMSKADSEYNSIFSKAEYLHFTNFTRLFISDSKRKNESQDDFRLAYNASNLKKVLKRILENKNTRNEIMEILYLLIPGFSKIEVRTDELGGSDNLFIYEDALDRPLTTRLISDGTKNIIAILTAVYQSEEPQFLCIEEPENGLNPKVVKLLVDLFRDKCKENGHFIWLNTHSQSLVAELTPDEIILVDKVKGLTQIKQIQGKNMHGLKMDDALFTNTLGGGIPW